MRHNDQRYLQWRGSIQRFAALVVVALGSACSDGGAASQSVRDDQLIFHSQDQVRKRLRDPASAQFTDVSVSRKAGVPAVCGSVNSRNGFGGMSGPERFIAGGKTGLESDFAPGEFDLTWAKLC